MSYRPQNKTILDVLTYLESIGLQTMGDFVDLETGALIGGCHMTFSPDDVLQYRRLHAQGRIHAPN